MRIRYPLTLTLLLVFAGCGAAERDGASDAGQESASEPVPSPAPVAPSAEDAPASGSRHPDEGPRVVFFGTSLTAGLGLPSPDLAYVAHVADLAREAGLPFRAVNAGVSGETSAAGARRIDWVLEDPLDILVIELGANDGLRGLPTEELEKNLIDIIRETKERYPEARVVLAAMEAPPNLGQRYTTEFRRVFETVAEAEGALLAPFILEGVAGVPAMNQSDGIHPTPDGHRRMAENLWPTLRRALEAVPATAGAAVAEGAS